jgi:hypothetical protein
MVSFICTRLRCCAVESVGQAACRNLVTHFDPATPPPKTAERALLFRDALTLSLIFNSRPRQRQPSTVNITASCADSPRLRVIVFRVRPFPNRILVHDGRPSPSDPPLSTDIPSAFVITTPAPRRSCATAYPSRIPLALGTVSDIIRPVPRTDRGDAGGVGLELGGTGMEDWRAEEMEHSVSGGDVFGFGE